MLSRKDAMMFSAVMQMMKRQINDPDYAEMLHEKLHIQSAPPKQTYENLILQARNLKVRCE